MSTTELLERLVRELGDTCGFDLTLVEESIIDGEDGYVVAVARSHGRASATRQVRLDAVAEILISPDEVGGTETWALVFFYVNGTRVAPPGRSHLTMRWAPDGEGPSRWVARDWEEDVYDEWTEMGRLEDP